MSDPWLLTPAERAVLVPHVAGCDDEGCYCPDEVFWARMLGAADPCAPGKDWAAAAFGSLDERGGAAMSDGRTHVERWRTHRPPASRHWPRDPDDTNTHPGADPAACAICNPKDGAA